MTIQKITPFLWFDSEAEEAANYYVSIFPNSRIRATTHFPGAGQEVHGKAADSVMTVEFELDGQEFIALNGGPDHKFNDAVSFVVPCESQEEIDSYWEKLSDGGRPIQCGWIDDRYGLSWQIVPAGMGEILGGPDPEKGAKAMQAMLGMIKLDIAALKRARNG